MDLTKTKWVLGLNKIIHETFIVSVLSVHSDGYKQATHKLLFGTDAPSFDHKYRWSWNGEKFNYNSSPLKDYEDVFFAVWAK